MREYQSNSHRSKELAKEATEVSTEKKVEAVISGTAKTKKNTGRNLMNIFVSEDAENVKSYIFMDVIVPAIKKAILDIASDGVSMILYGDTKARKSSSGSKIAYGTYYSGGNGNRSSKSVSTGRVRFDYEDIVFDTRVDAISVLEGMNDCIDRYGIVSVADMYELARLAAPFTANKYGWSSLRTAETVRVKDGYILKLPKASPLD